MIVEEQAKADKPCRSQSLMVGQDEAQRPDYMRRHIEENFTFAQAFADQAKLVIFQIAESAMDQFGRGGRRPAGEIVLLAEKDGESASGGIAGDTAAIDAAADNAMSIYGIFIRVLVADSLSQTSFVGHDHFECNIKCLTENKYCGK